MPYRSTERVSRILGHEEADRVPYCAIGGKQVHDLVDRLGIQGEHREMCLDGDFAFVYLEPEPDMAQLGAYFGDLPPDVRFTCWGIGRQAQKTQEGWPAGHRMFHPLAGVDTVAELRSYPFPDAAGSGIDRGLEERISDLKGRGYTVLGQMSQTILETAYNMRGMVALFTDFFERPGYVEFLFDRILEQRLFQARRFAEAGVDILRIGDDIASQEALIVSPTLYRDWIGPRHAAVIAAARAVQPTIPVKYHSDGNLTELLPELIDIGVTIINPVQPECMDLIHTKREFGQDLVLWGCLAAQSVFARGSADDVRRHVEFLMEHVAPGGGLILKLTNFLTTEQSLENLGVFLGMFYQMGKYGG